MRLAVLSDVHGNYGALQAVLHDVANLKIDKFYFLGDYVGYYYDADLIIDKIIETNSVAIKGNHDQNFLDLFYHKRDLKSLKKYGNSYEITLRKFNDKHIDFLLSLKNQVEYKLNGISALFCHESQFAKDGYLYYNSSDELFELHNSQQYNYIFLGHSHYSFIKQLEHSTIVNVGSVGQNRSRGGVASYAIIDYLTNKVELKEVSYDIGPLLKTIHIYDPEFLYLENVLKR